MCLCTCLQTLTQGHWLITRVTAAVCRDCPSTAEFGASRTPWLSSRSTKCPLFGTGKRSTDGTAPGFSLLLMNTPSGKKSDVLKWFEQTLAELGRCELWSSRAVIHAKRRPSSAGNLQATTLNWMLIWCTRKKIHPYSLVQGQIRLTCRTTGTTTGHATLGPILAHGSLTHPLRRGLMFHTLMRRRILAISIYTYNTKTWHF